MCTSCTVEAKLLIAEAYFGYVVTIESAGLVVEKNYMLAPI